MTTTTLPSRSPALGRVRIGCDIGGTFTDIVMRLPDGSLHMRKASTTPDDPGRAVVEGIRAVLKEVGANPSAVSEIVHGTTVASNTILQKVGARTGVLTTLGFRDIVEIGRIRTPTMFDLSWQKPESLAPRRYRREVDERMAADGSPVRPLDVNGVRTAGEFYIKEGVQAVAVAFINSYVNSAHELQAKAILESEFPSLLVTASCEVLPEMREYERTSTTVVNAYILPNMRQYLARLQRDLRDVGISAPIRVMASNGGMMGLAAASDKPVFAVASGPAGGVTGSAHLVGVTGSKDAIVFDMGGTTAKACIVEDGVPVLTSEYEFRDGISAASRLTKGGGYVLKVPAIDIAEVGSGGGSVASVDAGGLLKVGPESMGALPGPACYGLGNELPTVTDANVVLGYLNPASLAGGSLPINHKRATDSVEKHIAKPLGLSLLEAAHGIRQIANINMARAIRAVTVERGRDPRDMTLLAFGGGGPLHAVDVARILGVRRVIAPVMAGAFCSAGMLAADGEHDFLRVVLKPLTDCRLEELRDIVAQLRKQAESALRADGYPPDTHAYSLRVDLRYVGQSSELTVAIREQTFESAALSALRGDYQRMHHDAFGYVTEESVELVNIRLRARGSTEDRLDFSDIRLADNTTNGRTRRAVSFERGAPAVDTPVVPRRETKNSTFSGPLIIESYDTTVLIPPGATVTGDALGNLMMEVDV